MTLPRKIFRILVFLCLTLTSSPVSKAKSGSANIKPPLLPEIVITAFQNPATASPDGYSPVVIPLKRAGRLFLMEARIDNQVGNFIFDTGSSKLVLNKTYFRKFIVMDEEEAGGVTGSTGGIGRTTVKSLEIADLHFSNLSADVTSLGHIEDRRGIKILGLVGLSLLKDMEIVVDLNHNELHLFRLDKKGNRLGSSTQKKVDLTHKVTEYNNILIVKATIGGKQLDFCLDSGAESNVLSSYSSKSVLGTVTILKRSDMVGVASGQTDVLYGMMNDFNLGERRFPTMRTIITSLHQMSKSYGMVIDGMLGYDFFSQGVIYLNLVRNEMGICFSKLNDIPK